MFKMKRVVLISLLLLIPLSFGFCADFFSPKVTFDFHPAVLLPTDDYLVTDGTGLRVTGGFEFAVYPASFSTKSFSYGAGCNFNIMSKSQVVDHRYLKPYIAVGPSVFVEKNINSEWGVLLSASLMFGWYKPLLERFAYLKFNAEGILHLMHTEWESRIDLILPVSVIYKNDAVSLSAGIGFDFDWNTKIVKKGETK